ncbi:ester cyclase [Actinophytocola gossypii]|uniref:Ester cyclase n=1 Tax=Actinophytocola gossypii TaxID=2812003 RepID=A0ABT2J5J6_9PSEU|nr:ester cyclase [Actinophytocola gossypii]MCT2583137.1 ester cyclase [Actinophytocola gossypii]
MSAETSTETSKAICVRFHEAMNTRDPETISTVIDELVDPDVVFHSPAPLPETGARAIAHVWDMLLRAFPDLHVAVEDVIAEGDKVVIRNVVTGSHLGDYQGLAPTGRSVSYNEMFVIRFADGRIAEIWGVVDLLTQLRQLGAIPA